MKSRKASQVFRSFQDIPSSLRSQLTALPDQPGPAPREMKIGLPVVDDEAIFTHAMEGVTPVPGKDYVQKGPRTREREEPRNLEEEEVLTRLADLVKYGTGFHVCDTPEYVEGVGYRVHPSIAKRLHQGDFSIEAHLDLHGFLVSDAKEAFDRFMRQAILRGKKGILIIHGRGLSSPAEPVLKNKVMEWLTRGIWRKWVLAYTSARSCDGGAGATYILIRQRPASKRFRRSGKVEKR